MQLTNTCNRIIHPSTQLIKAFKHKLRLRALIALPAAPELHIARGRFLIHANDGSAHPTAAAQHQRRSYCYAEALQYSMP